jgi:hypothetical protein
MTMFESTKTVVMDFIPVGAPGAEIPARVVDDGPDRLPRGVPPGRDRLGFGSLTREPLTQPA